MIINYYKTNLGVVFSIEGYGINVERCKFNGVMPKLFSRYWWVLPDCTEINIVEQLSCPKKILSGFVLKTPALASDSIPLKLPASVWHMDEYDEYSFGEFEHIRPLYEETYETSEPTYEDITSKITFKLVREITISSFDEPEKMVVGYTEGSYGGNQREVDLSGVVSYSDIEKLLTPEFVLHARPCSITGDMLYKIVRNYVKNNINPRAARITSDYDFCFTVQRVVNIKPVTKRKEVTTGSGKSYRTPKFKNITEDTKLVEVFECTPPSSKYGKYTVMQGLEATNLQDMADRLKHYLEALMEEINREMYECEHCNGLGTKSHPVKWSEITGKCI